MARVNQYLTFRKDKGMSEKIPYDYSVLRGRIIEKCGSIGKFAEIFGISKTSMSDKLNNNSSWSQEDISKAVKILQIEDPATVVKCFFREA
jgi:hypothetical protein